MTLSYTGAKLHHDTSTLGVPRSYKYKYFQIIEKCVCEIYYYIKEWIDNLKLYIMYNERPKMKRGTRQKTVLRKGLGFFRYLGYAAALP